MSAVYSKSFFKEMRKLKEYIYSEKDKELASVYLKLERFVLDCSYVKYKYASKIVKMLLEGRTSSDIAKTLGISETTVRYHEHTSFSKKLYEIFGKDIFRILRDYHNNTKEVEKRLFLALRENTSRLDYCMSDVVSEVSSIEKSENIVEYDLKDCTKELAFIAKYSLANMKRDLSVLNIDKVEYLMKVLDGEKGSIDDRFNFVYRIEEL